MALTDMMHESRVIIKDAIRPLAQTVADAHELSFKVLKGSFNRGQFKMVLQFGVPSIEAEMQAEFEARIAPALGFPEDIVGQEYTIDGITYVITGINPKLNSKCMRVKRVQGNTDVQLCTTPSRIRTAMGLPDPMVESEELNEDGDDV
jgi:hypothetical protein